MPKTKYHPPYDILRLFKLSNAMDFLQIRFGHLKLTSATPGLSNPCKLRFKSNITGIFVTDIYRIVGDIESLTQNSTTTISCASSKIRKAWTLNNNPLFLTYHPIGVMIAIMVYEVRHLDRGLMVVVHVLRASIY